MVKISRCICGKGALTEQLQSWYHMSTLGRPSLIAQQVFLTTMLALPGRHGVLQGSALTSTNCQT